MDLDKELDAMATQARTTPPFDVTPRGIRFRPDELLKQRTMKVAALGNLAVTLLNLRLETVNDPFLALLWLYTLQQVGTPEATATIEKFVKRLKQERLWADEFPGPREILLFLGRDRA